MGRLIDADELISILGFENTQEERDENVWKIIIIALEGIDRIPTAYDPDKVVQQLENERKFWENAYDSNLGKEKARSYEHAIEIVKGGGVDAN